MESLTFSSALILNIYIYRRSDVPKQIISKALAEQRNCLPKCIYKMLIQVNGAPEPITK